MNYTKLDQLIETAKKKSTRKLIVAAAADREVLLAVKEATAEQIISPLLVGDADKIKTIAREIELTLNPEQIIDEPDPQQASVIAVTLIREGSADILMKGLVATSVLLKAVISKENGLRGSQTLSHFALFELPHYSKLLGITDAAMNVAPDFNDKVSILQNAVSVLNRLGNAEPRVAILAPVETVNPKIESTVHAAMLAVMNQRGQINNCLVEGPYALDIAVSKEAAQHKGIKSEVGGNADLLLAPDLNSGNVLYKSLCFLCGASSAAIITGAKVPIVLTSRADSPQTKLYSIALAAALNK
ncbi:MAG TPA: bifunctional enoyl-CoA hydratase/phosphate acetyltransferase [Bacteroidales bacterium]|nr:bifunctional enoyl-CoA hydratase/phosphate acetyltransferase [Bacteroidales bacterium]